MIAGTKAETVIGVIEKIPLKHRNLVKEITAHVKNMGRSLKFEKKTNGFFNIFFLFT